MLEEVKEWQARPLDPVYPIIFFDALRVKVRDEGLVKNKAVYVALTHDVKVHKHVLGLWIEQSEGAKGRKRHILTDTCGFLICILVHAADIQDRNDAVDVLAAIRSRFPWLRHVFADGGYAGVKLRSGLAGMGKWTIEIIKCSDRASGFEVLPRRWVVERTFAWLGRCRRLAKDWERSIASSTAWALIASIRMLTRRTARYCHI